MEVEKELEEEVEEEQTGRQIGRETEGQSSKHFYASTKIHTINLSKIFFMCFCKDFFVE